MIRQKAERLAALCCERKWIEEDAREWCVYALEKWMGLGLFFLAVVLWMLFSGLWLETTAFLAPFYLLRRRMGGCHAKSPHVCFFFSVGLVVLVSALLGRLLLALPAWLLLAMDGAAVLTLFLLSPAYPPQVNFTQEEAQANGKRKNLLLAGIFLLQLLSLPLLDGRFLACSLCGLVFSAATIIIQKNILKRGFTA